MALDRPERRDSRLRLQGFANRLVALPWHRGTLLIQRVRQGLALPAFQVHILQILGFQSVTGNCCFIWRFSSCLAGRHSPWSAFCTVGPTGTYVSSAWMCTDTLCSVGIYTSLTQLNASVSCPHGSYVTPVGWPPTPHEQAKLDLHWFNRQEGVCLAPQWDVRNLHQCEHLHPVPNGSVHAVHRDDRLRLLLHSLCAGSTGIERQHMVPNRNILVILSGDCLHLFNWYLHE